MTTSIEGPHVLPCGCILRRAAEHGKPITYESA